MPYIKQADREALENNYNGGVPIAGNPGQLNYVITQVILEYLHTHSHARPDYEHTEDSSSQNTYSQLNEVLGVLEACKMEFYRRMVVPYEDQKIKENGDVY